MTILTFTLCPNLSALGFKFKTGLHAIFFHLSLATVQGALLLRIIPSVCLFTSVNGMKQQYKLKPKIIFDRSF